MHHAPITQEIIINAIKEVYDPELPVNIYDLGLIYNIEIIDKHVNILMTLTTPSCPAAEFIPNACKEAILSLQQVESVHIELTFDPPYNPDKMSATAKIALGWV